MSRRKLAAESAPAITAPRRAERALPSDIVLLGESLGYAIRRAQVHAFQEFTTWMRALDVRPAQYALLVLIYENPGVQQSVAGSVLGIEKANLTGLLLELVERGLIHRGAMFSDHRVYTLHISAKGSAVVPKLIKQHARYEASLAKRLTEKEREVLLGLLKKVRAG